MTAIRMTQVVDIELKRDAAGAPCPCNGYADRDDSVTPEELSLQTCGSSFACCVAAFVCRLCGKRFVVRLPSPEWED